MSKIANGRGQIVAAEEIPVLAAGTMVSTDLDLSRRFYEEFLGLDCVRYAQDRLLIRDPRSKAAMEKGETSYFVIDVRKVDVIEHPQHVLNHWGFTIETKAEVERIRAEAVSKKDYFGLRKIMPITNIHGSYGFYFTDRDQNWWEIEYRGSGRTNDLIFEGGDGDVTAEPAH